MSTYEDASLIYYPSGYKAGKAYSLKPTDGTGDLTFTRASTATRVNESGLIESVATGVPRIDFTLGCGKLLLEPQRSNLIFPSATGSTQTVTTTAQSYTLSFYGTGTVVRSGTSTGTLVGTGANDRVFVTFTATAGSLILTVTGSVTNWQLEAGAYLTSVIITTTTAVTRTQDSASRTAASAFVGLSSGTIYLDLYQEIKSGELDILSINNASTNYLLRCRLNGNSLSFAYNGGTGGTNLAANVNLVNNSRNKIAIKYNAATKVSRTYFNGVFHSTTTGANAYPVLAQNNILIGPWFGTSYMQLQGLMLFTTELSDADLETLTTL